MLDYWLLHDFQHACSFVLTIFGMIWNIYCWVLFKFMLVFFIFFGVWSVLFKNFLFFKCLICFWTVVLFLGCFRDKLSFFRSVYSQTTKFLVNSVNLFLSYGQKSYIYIYFKKSKILLHRFYNKFVKFQRILAYISKIPKHFFLYTRLWTYT
jgi:hypothetical protein